MHSVTPLPRVPLVQHVAHRSPSFAVIDLETTGFVADGDTSSTSLS
jgi:DNA polymerase III epsilon subunit-like protein